MNWHAYSYKSVLRWWWYISLRFTMSERRANFPCRQLNSEKIKGAALCYLSPIVVDKCSVVTCKCTCNMDEGLQKVWSEVCRTLATRRCKVCIQNELKCQLWILITNLNNETWFLYHFLQEYKVWPFSLVLSAHKGQRKRRRKIKKT